jgi:hypothetical protein
MIPAPRAENMERSVLTISVSNRISGSRLRPMKEERIWVRTLVWSRTLRLSRKIFDTAWPEVPEEVMVLATSLRSQLSSW